MGLSWELPLKVVLFAIINACAFHYLWLINPSKDNDVIFKRLTGIWNVWRNENKDDPWPTEHWVPGLKKKKKKKKEKKRKGKKNHSTFFDTDLFYFT